MNIKIILCIILIIQFFTYGCGEKGGRIPPDNIIIIKDQGKFGYAGFYGGKKLYISPQFDFAWHFSEGLAVIALGQKFGYVDTRGVIVIETKFDMAYDFSEDTAKVRMGNKYGFIDRSGNFIIQPQFDDATAFWKGVAEVRKGKELYKIDKSGKAVHEKTAPEWEDKKTKEIIH